MTAGRLWGMIRRRFLFPSKYGKEDMRHSKQGGKMERDIYLVSEWALIRRNELVDMPEQLVIHTDFLQTLTQEEFARAFREMAKCFGRCIPIWRRRRRHLACLCIRQESMIIFRSRLGKPEQRLGIFSIFCSACLPAGISEETDLWRIRRKSGRSTE